MKTKTYTKTNMTAQTETRNIREIKLTSWLPNVWETEVWIEEAHQI